MKKILMFLCCVIMFSDAWAGCNSPITLYYRGVQKPGDNEFLYDSKEQYDEAVAGYKNTKKTSGDGKGYECDAEYSASCHTGDTVTLPAGHVYKGTVVNKLVTYECKTPYSLSGVYLNDVWKPVEKENICATSGFGKIPVGKCVGSGSGGCRELTKSECSGYKQTDTENATAYNGICMEGPSFICKAVKCKAGMTVNYDTGKCVPKVDLSGKRDCRGSNGGIIKHGSSETTACISNSVGVDQCKRTCNDGLFSEWEVISCVKGYDLKDGNCVKSGNPTPNCRESRSTNIGKACCDIQSAVYNAQENTCTCQNGKTFELYDTNHGRCVGGGDVVPTPSPVDPTPSPVVLDNCSLDMFADWRSLYKDCSDVIAALDELELYCVSSDRNEAGYMTRYNKLMQLRKMCEDVQKREEAARNQRITRSTAIINNAEQKLDDIMAGLKINVWKTAEGNFNGARLASDSIAGVVLGTAGGLITSHLVKKGQVKNGFEDIQCTVGGQKVADWGDEFTVGIR